MPRPSLRWLLAIPILYSSLLFCQQESQESVESRIAVADLEPIQVRSFLAILQERIAKNDSRSVCAIAIYPLVTQVLGRVRSADHCRRNYARIFNSKVANAVKNQKFESLFAHYKGVMVGSGEVWISGVCRDKECADFDLGIIAVNNRKPL